MTITKIGKKQPVFHEIGKNVKFGKNCILRNFIFIGDNCVIGDRVRISNFCNIDRDCVIGNDVNFQYGVYLPQDTIVGNNCFFSIQVGVLDEKYPAAGRQIRKPVVFGDNVIVGGGSKFIGGIKIGDNSVIGMGSVVIEDVPKNAVVAGVPAKIISTREEYNKKKLMWENVVFKQKHNDSAKKGTD
jgi:acetyltransferase-like isoleucine patch superfamily enzyme